MSPWTRNKQNKLPAETSERREGFNWEEVPQLMSSFFLLLLLIYIFFFPKARTSIWMSTTYPTWCCWAGNQVCPQIDQKGALCQCQVDCACFTMWISVTHSILNLTWHVPNFMMWILFPFSRLKKESIEKIPYVILYTYIVIWSHSEVTF